MNDPRNKKLAKVFSEHSLKIKKNDKVVISTSDLDPVDLIRECYKDCLQKGAYVYLDIMGFNLLLDRSTAGDLAYTFYENATDIQIKKPPKIYGEIAKWGDKFIRITSIHNDKHLATVDSDKIQMRRKASQDWFDEIIDKDWVLTYFPTPSMSQKSGMSQKEFEDFYFRSTLADYDKMHKQLKKIANRIDKGKEIRVVGYKTDLRLSIKGRTGNICSGQKNIPDGEVFTGPVEDATEGHIYYEFPGLYSGKEIKGIYLEFKKGKVVKATSESNQDSLDKVLATDPGAKRLGEFAIGANYGIKEFMKETLFDEKIGGTIHTALGKSYNDPTGWGKNKSAIHWDIVKDTRRKGSYVEIDGKKILENGKILV